MFTVVNFGYLIFLVLFLGNFLVKILKMQFHMQHTVSPLKFIIIIVPAGISMSINKLKRMNWFISWFCVHYSINCLQSMEFAYLILRFYFELFFLYLFLLFFPFFTSLFFDKSWKKHWWHSMKMTCTRDYIKSTILFD